MVSLFNRIERKSIMDSDGSQLLLGSLIILLFVLVKSFFTAAEFAVTEINDAKVKSFKEKNGAKKILFSLMQKPSKLITAFAVHRILSAVLIAYMSMFVYHSRLSAYLEKNTHNTTLSQVLSIVIIFAAVVLVMTVVCDGVPKRIVCRKDADTFAIFAAPIVKYLVILLLPLTSLCGMLTTLISRIFGVTPSDDRDVVTEEEILMMVDAGNETGVIEESQRDMINNVFEFDDMPVSDIMTHRTSIIGVEKTLPIQEVINASISSGFSRIPVYDDSIDHITGIVCVKDLLCLIGSDYSKNTEAKTFVRETIFVPETMPCGKLFKMLTAKKMQMAVVIDEYGGTAGLVTMEDVVESIVGNIQDEYDDEHEEIVKVSENTFTIDGTAEPEEILEQLGITLPEDNNFDTMSGFIVDLIGRIPEENENPSVEYGNVRFTVLVTEDMHVAKIKAEILKKDEDEKEQNANEEKD